MLPQCLVPLQSLSEIGKSEKSITLSTTTSPETMTINYGMTLHS